MNQPPTDQQLTPAEIRLAQYGQRTSTWSTATYNDGTEKALHEIALGLKAEVDKLRTRVTELEGPAVEARAALAALCYDLEDPGTAALGALYLISRATTGVDAPKDDTALALAQHDAQVLRKAAQVLEETDRDDDAVNLLYTLADSWERDEETHVVADDSDDPEHVDDCPGCEAAPVVAAVSSAAENGDQP